MNAPTTPAPDAAREAALAAWIADGDRRYGSTMHRLVPAAFGDGWKDGGLLIRPNRHAYTAFDNLRAAYLAGRRARRAHERAQAGDA